MAHTNCLNCGAPFDTNNEKCSYCGTSYYDMSAMELNGKPFMLKIKTVLDGRECYITELVRASPSMEMTFNHDTVNMYGGLGQPICAITKSYSVLTNITFEAVPRKSGELVKITIPEGES